MRASKLQGMIRRFGIGEGSARVETLARGLELLGSFSEEREELSLKELAEISGLAKPTAMRMLRTLEELGFVSRSGRTYRVGPQCFALGRLYRFDADLQSRALPVMRRLSEETNEVVQLGAMRDGQVLYLERVTPQRSVMVSSIVTQPGSLRPAYCTALGKAILVSQDEAATDSYIENAELIAHTPSTITDREVLRAEVELARGRGYSVDDCETDEEVRCVGAAISSGPGKGGAALSISTPEYRMPEETRRELGGLVREAAAEISVGYAPGRRRG